jgi:site-specific DNA-methyltransferase (adenine-specific)
MKIDLKIEPDDWHEQSARWGHPVHSICSYMASFPPRVPHYFISRFTKPGDIVLDPFSGRGTTPSEACMMGRKGIGSDLNPMAVVLTKAKVKMPRQKSVNKRLNEMEKLFEPQPVEEIPWQVKMLYSDKVLKQLCYMKQELNLNSGSVDNFLMAIILGGMHGDSTKANYLSIPMPNTFSMSPTYVKKYIKNHKLKPPQHDVFDMIRYRLDRYYKVPTMSMKGEAYPSDIRDISGYMKGRKANLIFSSPPYLKVIRYGKLNWIRLWMLGNEAGKLDNKLDDKHTMPKYLNFIESSINECSKVMKDDGLCFFVVGQVSGNRGLGKDKSVDLGYKIMDEFNGRVNMEFIGVIDDLYNKDSKVSRIWGATKGEATKYDQIVVMCKNKAIIKKKKYSGKVDWS